MTVAIAGTAYVRVDGTQYDLRGNCKVNIAPFTREGIVGLDRVHGYSQKPALPYFEMELSDSATVSLETLHNITSATITLELINGKTYALREAWCANNPELAIDDGMFTIRFEGKSGEEITAAATT